MTVSVGVKSTDRVWVPPGKIVPAGGVYTNEPGTVVVAFNCVAPRGVPKRIGAGVGQVMTGVALLTTKVTLAVALV